MADEPSVQLFLDMAEEICHPLPFIPDYLNLLAQKGEVFRRSLIVAVHAKTIKREDQLVDAPFCMFGM